MDSIAQKLSDKKISPAEAAAMDASIRESKRSVGIRKMIADVTALHEKHTPSHEIQVLLPQWEEEYPKLFAMILDPEYSRVTLNAMLAQLEAVENGKKTTHDASVNVGTVLVNSFVRPKLGMEPVPLPDSGKQSDHRKGKRTAGSS
jgi:hypothetical protein